MNDYHIHLHDHGESGRYSIQSVQQYVDVGRRRGVRELGFSEHVFRFREVNALLGEWWSSDPSPESRRYCETYVAEHSTQSLDEYVEVLEAAKSQGMPVKIGLEIDYYPGRMRLLSDFLDNYPLDFRLGSVHWIGAWGFDDPGTIGEWEHRDVADVWAAYFGALEALALSGAVDILAHPDLVKKFGNRPATEPVDYYRRIASIAAGQGVAFELSSAGLRKPIGEAYPSALFLDAILAEGASISTASDAHLAQDVGADFERLRDIAETAGFREAVSFAARTMSRVSL